MYYIINQNDQVIAVSADLMELLQVGSIDALYRQIALDAIEFDIKADHLAIKTPLDEKDYRIEKEILFSMLGNMTLIRLYEEETSNAAVEESLPVLDEEEDILFEMREEPEETGTETLMETAESLIEETPVDKDEVLFELKEEPEETENLPIDTISETEKDLLDLTLPSTTEETIDEIEDEEAKKKASESVYVDIEKISESIGISTEDYNTFLTEYIDTALSLEDDLRSTEKSKRTAAIHTLFHLSNVLQLPLVTEIIEQLKYTETEDIESSIQSFYDTLSRLTTTKPETEIQAPAVNEEEEEREPEKSESFGTIDLSDVKPIHFDFQVEVAANELSLPAELIEEFIHDFIKQAREETGKMLEAYEKGDLETIQKIGHLLKGTASNLRINPLADTLYEIQFCNDSSQLEKLIKEYWAHFISFETQFKLTSNKGN